MIQQLRMPFSEHSATQTGAGGKAKNLGRPTMATFEAAIPVVLEHEGGLVDDPADPGGLTNFGISQRWYPDIDIRALTRESAEAIYRRDFWRYDGIIDQAVATKLLDMAVQWGTSSAVTITQEALRDGGTIVVWDGLWGPQTEAAVNARGPAFIKDLRLKCVVEYVEIVAARPELSKFLLGWMRRALS